MRDYIIIYRHLLAWTLVIVIFIVIVFGVNSLYSQSDAAIKQLFKWNIYIYVYIYVRLYYAFLGNCYMYDLFLALFSLAPSTRRCV